MDLELINEDLYQNGSSQCNISPSDLPKIHAAWNLVQESELAPVGIEQDSHCTLRYGLQQFNFNQLYNLIHLEYYKFNIDIIDVDFFDTKGGDCVFFKVQPCDTLLKLRSLIEENSQCIENTFPTYVPHITLFYVKKGLGETLRERIKSELEAAFTVMVDSVIITEKNGKRSTIPLRGEPSKAMAEQALFDLIWNKINR